MAYIPSSDAICDLEQVASFLSPFIVIVAVWVSLSAGMGNTNSFILEQQLMQEHSCAGRRGFYNKLHSHDIH